jgi:hypothetical protein
LRAGGLLLILIFVAFLVEKWLFQCHYTKYSLRRVTDGLMWLCIHSSGCMVTFFFGFEEPHPRKVHFVGLGERLKPQLSQALTRDARPDSNSRPAVQISSPLPSHHAPWGRCMVTRTVHEFKMPCIYIYELPYSVCVSIYIVKWGNFQNIFLFNFSIKINIWKNIMI